MARVQRPLQGVAFGQKSFSSITVGWRGTHSENQIKVRKNRRITGQPPKIEFLRTKRDDRVASCENPSEFCDIVADIRPKMCFSNFSQEKSRISKMMAEPELACSSSVCRNFVQIETALSKIARLVTDEFDIPITRRINALVLLPEGTQSFDKKTAGAAGGVGDADFDELRHEFIGASEIAFLASDGVADFIDDFSSK